MGLGNGFSLSLNFSVEWFLSFVDGLTVFLEAFFARFVSFKSLEGNSN